MSNSVELTSVVPRTSRANSMTAHWRPEAQARGTGRRVVARAVGGQDLALDAAMAEAAGDQDAGRAVERARARFSGVSVSESTQRTLRVDAVRPGRVAERLGDGQVGVRQLDVLADERDLEDRLGRLDALDERAPAVEVRDGVGIAQAELADDESPEPERLELERDLVDRLGRRGRDDGVDVDVAEQGDLLADLVGHRRGPSAGR